MSDCTKLEVDKASDSVTTYLETFSGIATDAISEATYASESISKNVGSVFMVDTSPRFVTLGESIGDLSLSDALDSFPDLAFATPELGYTPPSSWNITPIEAGTAPTFTAAAPSYNPPQQPAPIAVTDPGDAPSVGDIFVPAPPSLVLPAVPTARTIVVPEPEELSLPIWGELAPDADIPDPSGEFVWADEDYTSLTLDQVTARIQTMLQGGTGLPDAIWNMIWDRNRAALYEQRDAAIDEATERWAARGFSVPGGALNKQIEKAIHTFNNLSAEQLRETAIKQAEMEVQNLQFAVAQGIALETQLMSLFNQRAARSLEAAKAVFQIAIDLYQAKVSRYNIEAQVYSAKAQVYKTLIDAELAKLEEYKIQLEGQKLVGELNLQDVQVYTARVEAVGKEVDIFKAQLDGVRTQVEVDKTRVEAYAQEVGAYGERVKAKAIEYEAYNTALKGEQTKADIFKALSDAYGAQVEGYSRGIQAKATQAEVDIKKAQLDMDRFKVYLGKFETEAKLEELKLDAITKKYATEVEQFKAKTAYEAARLEWVKAESGLELDSDKLAAQRDIARFQGDVERARALAALAMEADKAQAQIQAQLAASAMAALNVSASISYSGSDSNQSGCSTSYNYEGTS